MGFTYEHNRLDETSIVDRHRCHIRQLSVVCLLMRTIASWLPKLHTRPYKLRFIANSRSCTTTELSILLTSCLSVIKTISINIAPQFMKEMVKHIWSIKISGVILNKFKFRDFLASGLATYDFSTLYTTLPHNLIKEKTNRFN